MHAIPENTILPQVIIKEFLKNDDSGIDFEDTDIDIKEKEKKNMIVSNAIEKMIDFYQGSQHDQPFSESLVLCQKHWTDGRTG